MIENIKKVDIICIGNKYQAYHHKDKRITKIPSTPNILNDVYNIILLARAYTTWNNATNIITVQNNEVYYSTSC